MAIASTTKVILPDAAAPKTPGDDPTELHPEILRLRTDSYLARCLMGGTQAMRLTREMFLPRMRHELDDTYNARISITALRNFYRQSLTALAGKLMRNGLNLEDGAGTKAPAEAEQWLKDMDGEGTPGDVMFKRLFTWSVRDAASWLLVDYPRTGGNQSLADERDKGIRPFLIPLSCLDIYGWREEKVNGRMVTTQLRYKMVSDEPVGLYGRQRVETCRVIEPDRIIDLRQNAKGQWERFGDEMVNTFGRVALTRIASDMDENSRPRGGMTDLADLNLEHWQIRSDQRLALRVNSFPILFGAGFEGNLPPIGPETSILSDNPTATLSYTESSGAALTAGRTELTDLEDTMRAMSAQYQVKQVAQTATGAAIDAADANAPAQGWAINCKRGFEKAMGDMAEFAGLGQMDITLRVDTDALVSSMSADKLLQLQAARASRDISRETYLAALKRADILPDEYDPEADQGLLDQEAPDLSGMNTPPGAPPGAPQPKPNPTKKP